MSFTNSLFLIGLLPPFVFIYVLSAKSRNLRTALLALANMVFLIFGGIYSLIALLIESLLAYLFAKSLLKRQSRTKLLIFAGILLLPLFVYKLFSALAINAIGILGISFFTFEAVSLVADAYNLKYRELDYGDVLLYLTFFVTITSGPIIRFPSFRKSLDSCSVDLNAGIERFAIGLCKKLLLADKLAILADYYFDGVAIGLELSSLGLIIGSIAYSLQLYYDFSGYSDMAIGIGHMLGFDIIENFKQPYKAKGIQDFWHRWHISLSEWLRDYIYIPLGGNRVSPGRHIFNIMVVWALTGLWHGAAWNFVIWGIYYGVLLLIEKYFLQKFLSRIPTVFGWIYTIIIVMTGWVFFFSPTLGSAAGYLKIMVGIGANGLADRESIFLLVTNAVLWILAAAGSAPYVHRLYERVIYGGKKIRTGLNCMVYAALFLLCVAYLVSASYNPFLYFRF